MVPKDIISPVAKFANLKIPYINVTKIAPKLVEIHRLVLVQKYNLIKVQSHSHNPYQPPKNELLTLGSFSNSFPDPE